LLPKWSSLSYVGSERVQPILKDNVELVFMTLNANIISDFCINRGGHNNSFYGGIITLSEGGGQ